MGDQTIGCIHVIPFRTRATPTFQYTDVILKMKWDEKGLTNELRATLSPLQTWQHTHPSRRIKVCRAMQSRGINRCGEY
jgi:hypothetical protein